MVGRDAAPLATLTIRPPPRSTIPRPPPVTRPCWPSSSANRAADLVERLRVLERREVPGVAAEHTRTDGAPDDLGAARLRERRDENDPLRPERLPELVGDGGGDL